MKRRCKHTGLLYQGAFWLECCDCGFWLSLGPANDSPAEVAIEIRAAEIAAGLTDNNSDFVMATSFQERRGFWLHSQNAKGREWKVVEDYGDVAGYLAHEIWSHDAIHTSPREERE